MEGTIRVSGRTVQDAVIEAALQLGTSRDNIEYTVIEKETKGFFGIGAKKAVVEAKKKKTDEEIMSEIFGDVNKEAPKKQKNRDAAQGQKKAKTVSAPEEKKVQEKVQKKEEAPAKEARKSQEKTVRTPAKENRQDTAEKAENPEKAEKKAVKKEAKNQNKQQKSQDKNQKKEQKTQEKVQKKSETPAKTQGEEGTAVREDQEQAVKTPRVPADPRVAEERAVNFLKDVFAAMDLNVDISAKCEDDMLSVNLEGDDMGILIGKRGQTLDSLQYLVSLVVNKGKASYVRVKLDTEDYRNRRKATLENLAKNIAFKVKKSRRPVYLEPMNPYERRIIHSALQNDPYVTTHSEGEEPCRKVVVTLKKKDRYDRSDRSDRYERSGRRDRTEQEARNTETEGSGEE